MHTPGPWKADDYYVRSADGYFLADCLASDNATEDARLIAAAPDILEALKELHEWVRESNDWRPDAPISRKVLAALAKADGST